MVRKKLIWLYRKKYLLLTTKTLTDDEYKYEGQCQGHKWYVFKKGEKTVIYSYLETKFCNVSRIYL